MRQKMMIIILKYSNILAIFFWQIFWLHKIETMAGVAESINIFGEKIESVPYLNSITFMFQNFEKGFNFSNICWQSLGNGFSRREDYTQTVWDESTSPVIIFVNYVQIKAKFIILDTVTPSLILLHT